MYGGSESSDDSAPLLDEVDRTVVSCAAVLVELM